MPQQASSRAGLVRVMTWNIHGGVGLDGRLDLQRIVALVRKHAPDLMALQEVGTRRKTDGSAEAFGFLAEALGSHMAESRLVTAPDGNYGHALICRWPLSGVACHDISYRRREPRAAIAAVAETPFGALHVIAAHLGLSFAERRHQAQLLAALVRSGTERTVVLGDLNDWLWRGSVQTTLNRLFPGHTHLRTFPAFWPVLSLDRIYCRPREMLAKQWTDPSARTASDHLPVIADLAMGTTETADLP
ncbi:endonuclease/exonuclease/phosphatase family protein [Chelativorans sp.]|uniref:endonuclease/exonuclease/phosphatase family protein n=1 Tax=Chelativorans sp. TaxID=2203393 RepID=UPI00281212FA|nr:endonuclease/exonuclease/phosphatase family protein [Chelativorans sp.]